MQDRVLPHLQSSKAGSAKKPAKTIETYILLHDIVIRTIRENLFVSVFYSFSSPLEVVKAQQNPS